MNLSSTYGSLFANNLLPGLPKLWSLVKSARRVGKLNELRLFACWEILHWFRFFGAIRYLQFNSQTPGTISASGAVSGHLILSKTTQFTPTALPWHMVVFDTNNDWWGFLFDDPTLYCSGDSGLTVRKIHTFLVAPSSVFITTDNALFVCCSGQIYHTLTATIRFDSVLTLSSTISYFLFNGGMTELPDGRLLLAEYGSLWQNNRWQSLAYLYESADGGQCWQSHDFLVRDGVNKHAHLIQYSSRLNAVFLTDGDNKKQAWINQSLRQFDQTGAGGWLRQTRPGWPFGGYLCMTETETHTLFGSDYLGGTNFVFSTTNGSRFTALAVPDPYRRSPVVHLATRQSEQGEEIWAVLHNSIAPTLRSLLMRSTDGGATWQRILDYDGTQHELKVVSSTHGTICQLLLAVITKKDSGFSQMVYKITESGDAGSVV